MRKVYFKSIDSYSKTEEIKSASQLLLQELIDKEKIKLEKFVPIKVHFGEKGNKTFIESKNYNGIIEYLKSKGTESSYIETNVLYRGERTTKTKHIKLAKEHGFTQIPIIIADGEYGDEFEVVEINKNHFKNCKIAKEIWKENQLIIASHFKGHMLAGFGGAIKQLAMGCASRGGKLDQHANSIPKVNRFRCKSCRVCVEHCPANAIEINKKVKINSDKCIGCAACVAICKYNAISNSWVASISSSFRERLVEYAYAAAKDKNYIYITYAFNITRGCDCEGHKMKPISKDIGIFASTDPVAIDQACLDMLDMVNGKKVLRRGRKTLSYAEKIGLGSKTYELVEL